MARRSASRDSLARRSASRDSLTSGIPATPSRAARMSPSVQARSASRDSLGHRSGSRGSPPRQPSPSPRGLARDFGAGNGEGRLLREEASLDQLLPETSRASTPRSIQVSAGDERVDAAVLAALRKRVEALENGAL